jgi:hypothetical protein
LKIGRLISYPVICLEVIDLLLENDGPKIFAEELDYVQIVGEAWPVSREAKELSLEACF